MSWGQRTGRQGACLAAEPVIHSPRVAASSAEAGEVERAWPDHRGRFKPRTPQPLSSPWPPGNSSRRQQVAARILTTSICTTSSRSEQRTASKCNREIRGRPVLPGRSGDHEARSSENPVRAPHLQDHQPGAIGADQAVGLLAGIDEGRIGLDRQRRSTGIT